ncbi:MAG: sulfotransferase [Ilumatobacteraceae bacterium]
MDRAAVVDFTRRAGRSVVRVGAMATADLRPEPELIVIGVKRGGTTSLFRDVERHPAMCPLVPSARRLPLRENMKGVHYFDSNFDRSSRWYRSHFPTSVARRWHERGAGAAFAAEASPYYLFHPLAAARAASQLTGTHFVAMLRDPVERTVSHWAEQTRNGVEVLSLTDALDAEQERVGDAGVRLADGTLQVSNAHEQQSYASQSEYGASLQRWRDAVGPDRVHVVFAEVYYADPQGVLDVITDVLGLPPVPAAAEQTHRNAAPRPSRVDPAVEQRLVDRFAPDVDVVAGLTGRRPPWPRFGGASPVPDPQ